MQTFYFPIVPSPISFADTTFLGEGNYNLSGPCHRKAIGDTSRYCDSIRLPIPVILVLSRVDDPILSINNL